MYNLDSSPDTVERAVAAAILIHPPPSVVYSYIPYTLEQVPGVPGCERVLTAGPAFTQRGADLLAAMVKDPHARHLVDVHAAGSSALHQRYAFYVNSGFVEHCCAFRLLYLLGLDQNLHQYGRFASDDAKLGIPRPQFFKYLETVDPLSYVLVETNSPVAQLTNESLIAAISAASGSALPTQTVIVILSTDHVSFAIRDDVDPISQGMASLPPGTRINDVIATLKDKYPDNAGRAGGKLLASWDMLRPIWPNRLVQSVVAHLLQADNDWEFVAAFALSLLPFVDLTGVDLVRFLDHSGRGRGGRYGQGIFSLPFVQYAKSMKELHTQGRMASRLWGYRRNIQPSSRARDWGNAIYGLDTLAGRSELYPRSLRMRF
jgi:hypothetical protein